MPSRAILMFKSFNVPKGFMCIKHNTPKNRTKLLLFLQICKKKKRKLINSVDCSVENERRSIFASSLRCGRDSNPRPHAWQACILTNWTTAPICYVILPFRKRVQRYCFFLTWPNIFAKKCKIIANLLLFALSTIQNALNPPI